MYVLKVKLRKFAGACNFENHSAAKSPRLVLMLWEIKFHSSLRVSCPCVHVLPIQSINLFCLGYEMDLNECPSKVLLFFFFL